MIMVPRILHFSKAEPISEAFPSTDKQSTLLHGIDGLVTLHNPSYQHFDRK